MSSLLEINPTLAKQWNPTKNGSLTPEDVTPGSNKKVWWICAKSHEWRAMVNHRSSGRGCPYCSGNKVTVETSLKTINPGLSSEWHTTMNGSLTPKDVTPGSGKRVWWICSRGHEWEAIISNMSKDYGKCPYCGGSRKA